MQERDKILEYLGTTVKVTMDRPLGSKHPDYDLYYPINYGFIENTVSGDGEEIDAYVLGEFEPLKEYEGTVIAVIKRLNDVEDKLVVAKALNSYNKEQIAALTEFQERYYESKIITFDHFRSSIRNTAKAIIRNGNEILVLEAITDEDVYYRLPGGGIEFCESSENALIREIKEELDLEVKSLKQLTTISHLYKVKEIPAHEITQIFEVELDKDVTELEGKLMTGDIIPNRFRWIKIEAFKSGSQILYPMELLEFI